MRKEHIIAEIRRTANANGGISLGRDRFFKETGIKESDWLGKYWVRWSEAVREAGIEPNKKKIAFDEEWLMEKYIALIREIGHFPVKAEIRMKVRRDPSFPNDKTFTDRFGPKRDLISKTLIYCKVRAGYEDVLDLGTKIVTNSNAATENEIGNSEQSFGFVYLVKSGHYYKIGRSNSSGRREYELTIQLPEKAKAIHTIRTDDPVGIENYWHRRFAEKRKNGEWFELNNLDIKAFRRRTFM